jgi:lipoprotein-anchoring transpeptidase ErfK/SrfK
VRGKNIKNVVFTVNGKTVSRGTKSTLVPATPGKSVVVAHVTFTGTTAPKTLRFSFRVPFPAARSAPRADAHRIEMVAARRPLTKVPTVLPVLGHAGKGDAWLHVLLPGRPNGHAGWISANRSRSGSTPWRIQVALSIRRVTVFHDGRVIRRFRAVVGKPSTPTPRGRFFVEEVLALGSAPGAPFALATSARSNALQEFDGGPGQIALHGTRYLSGRPGSAVSHGCVRLPTRAIAWLAKRVGAGVPLTIGR